jgi:flagellar hook-associated protein 1 FlgK
VSNDGTPGDGSVALELSKLQQVASAQLGGATPSQYLSSLVSMLGSGVARADVDSAVSATMADGLRAQREAVGGVSLDEEAVELLRHQRAFEAAAQFIRVINEITEIAVNLR